MTLQKLSFKEVHKPCSRNDRGHIQEERRLRIGELDEWRAHKPRTHDKPKLGQNKPDTSPNQLKVGDKVLLDAVDPHIVTTTLNKEIPITVLSIFPFGMVEVSHPKFGTFKHTRPGTWACLKPWPNRGIDTTVRYGCMEARHDFPKTRDAINPHGRVTWSWVNLIGEHERGNGKTRACQGQGSILFLRHGHETRPSIKPWTTIHRHVSTRAPRRALPNTSGTTFSSRPLYRLGRLSLQGISSMLSKRMIERHRGTSPPQYRLAQSTKEEAYEDIPDDLYKALKLIITEKLKLHREGFSTTAMSCSTTTIATTRYNILLVQDLWLTKPL
ncbi:hypothetical protein GOBAR_AA16046 [Gossypium barbadense]|uniref:Uncharacterized protein n=1 Tax=Gossypium barbadense TaxID=3634 RepID=A0A2P5XMR9_GOSBA|nr:hypothetical protein GOBAR_AA16046 [Gossypium barbadense]